MKKILRRLGRVGTIFIALLLLAVVLSLTAPTSGFLLLTLVLLAFFGGWVLLRLVRMVIRQAIWRLRNRLLVTYAFIAVVPVLLIMTMVGTGIWVVTTQVAVYLATSELERRTENLSWAANALKQTPPESRARIVEELGVFYRDRFPGIQIVVRDGSGILRYPKDSVTEPPPGGWRQEHGIVYKSKHFHGWAHAVKDSTDITILFPLTHQYLAELVPHLGEAYFDSKITGIQTDVPILPETEPGRITNRLPPPLSRFDAAVAWPSLLSAANWEHPGEIDRGTFWVHSRLSAVFNTILSQKAEEGSVATVFLAAVGILFLIGEMIALVIGVSLTRTITGAVHSLYDGTQRVQRGDFTHRIQVPGRDQLADLGRSFNSMTENLERLLAVAKEKERLQSEIEIAREVQNQLYPKAIPEFKSLELSVHCEPARMVSGDYYDYQAIQGNKLAFAIGDVAGKGISAALLMATLQSSLRTQLRTSLEKAAVAGNGASYVSLSTAHLVSQLNQQLYDHTSPEKYATFFFGLFDEASGTLTYTNAGHLPPILIRRGKATRLDVNGTVVGAFPYSEYEESRVQLFKDDLLVCYTDGITEPENSYGEMFEDPRLIEVLTRNADRDSAFIISSVMESVRQWTGSPELQDDMTILLVRRT